MMKSNKRKEMAHKIKLAREWRSERRSPRWWRKAKTGCLGPVCWRQAKQGKLLQPWLPVGKGGFPNYGGSSRWRERGRRHVMVAAEGPWAASRGGSCGTRGKGRRERGVTAWLSEGVILLLNPNLSYLFNLYTYLFIYLPRFIFLRGPTKKLTFVCSPISIK